MSDVFISYKRQERDRCESIAAKLRSLALDVWFDARLEAGNSFDAEIDGEVNAAKAVLVLWSPAAVKSEWVRNEATIGKNRGVLVAVELAPCTLPVNFVNTHCERLPARDFPDDEPAWLKVLERVGKLTGRPGLAEFAAATVDWRRAYPTDPLAKGTLRAAAPAASAPARRAGGAGMAAVAVVFALAVGAGAEALWPRSVAAPPPAAVAGQMVGRWRFPRATCDGALELVLGAGGLGFEDERSPLKAVGEDGASVMTAADLTYRLEAGELQVTNREGGATATFVRCP